MVDMGSRFGVAVVSVEFLCTGRMDRQWNQLDTCTSECDFPHDKWPIHRRCRRTDWHTWIARKSSDHCNRDSFHIRDDIRDRCRTDCLRSHCDRSKLRHCCVLGIQHLVRMVMGYMAVCLVLEESLQNNVRNFICIQMIAFVSRVNLFQAWIWSTNIYNCQANFVYIVFTLND